MSLLPGQILPQTIPIGTVQPDGTVRLEQNWWLLLYNLCQQVLGVGNNSGSLPADALQDLESADSDAIDADAISLRLTLSNALTQAIQPSDVVVTLDDIPDLQRALMLAQIDLLPDAAPRAQPVSSIAPSGSPYTYTAPYAGSIAITGGVVSAVALIRQGANVATGLTSGLIPASRGDQVQITYSSAPTLTFIPSSPA